MTVIKQYNSGNSQWEPIVVGKQGPPGTGGGGPFSGASKVEIKVNSTFYLHRFGDPAINPATYHFSQTATYFPYPAIDLLTVTDPDGILNNQISTGGGLSFTTPGSFLLYFYVQGQYVTSPPVPTNPSWARCGTVNDVTGEFQFVSAINSPFNLYNPFYGTMLAGELTQSDINDVTYLDGSIFFLPDVGQNFSFSKMDTTLYFWPSA